MSTLKQALLRVAKNVPGARGPIVALLRKVQSCDCGDEMLAESLDEMQGCQQDRLAGKKASRAEPQAVRAAGKKWIIMKSSRARDDLDVTEKNAYRGPAAEKTGVKPGQVYTDKKKADADAKKLGEGNPVGFTVVRLASAKKTGSARLAELRALRSGGYHARLAAMRGERTAAGIKVTAIKSKHGPTYKFKVEGRVGKIEIKAESTQVVFGIDKVSPRLVADILHSKIHRADGSGKSVTTAITMKVEKAVLAKVKEIEAKETGKKAEYHARLAALRVQRVVAGKMPKELLDKFKGDDDDDDDKKDKKAALNGYIAIYKGKKIEVQAKSSYEAQQIAAKQFRARKTYDVTVVLAEKGGQQVTHMPLFASKKASTKVGG